MKLKMLSFNIRCANDPDGHSIPERAPRVAELLREHKADIVGFQEYHLRWDASWSIVTDPDYEEMKVDRGDGEGLVLWWRKDKFRCLQKGHFWFGDDPNSPSTDWDEKYHKPRICAYLVLEDVESKTVFAYLNVHYGFGAAGQIKNAALLQQLAEKLGYPAVIAGDFNMEPGTPGYAAMAERFTDANAVTSRLAENSYHGYGLKEGMLLDHCFVTHGVKPLSYALITKTFDGKYPSDHYPVLIEAEL